jgi:hypothetical protein
MPMIAVVLPSSVVLHGSGCDKFRYVTGLTTDIVNHAVAIGGEGVILLQHSHTRYRGERYKMIIPYRNLKRWQFRSVPNRKFDDGQIFIIEEMSNEEV